VTARLPSVLLAALLTVVSASYGAVVASAPAAQPHRRDTTLVAGVEPSIPAETISLVIGLVPDADATAVLARLSASVLDEQPIAGLAAVVAQVPASQRVAALAALRADPAVRYVEPDSTAYGMAVPDPGDPLRADGSDGFAVNRIPAAWSWTTGSADVTVAVLDSGVSPNSDLDDGRVLAGHDFVNDDDNAADDHGHGTMVAGTIAGKAANGIGGAGVCWQCRILPVKVLGPTDTGGTSGSYADIAAGMVWAADHGADIINVSLGGSSDSQVIRDAVAHAVDAGALIVAAAGDKKTTTPTYPAAIEPVIAVGGTDDKGKPLSKSNTNPAQDPWIDLVAHGARHGLDHTGKETAWTGSSTATPLVSGAAALALSLRPQSTADQLRAALLDGSDPADPAWNGAHRLNAGKVTRVVGPADTEAPVVEEPGLPLDGTVLCHCGITVRPRVADNRDVIRAEIVVGGEVVASSTKANLAMYWAPVSLNGAVAVTVRAYDSSGNVGARTDTLEFDTNLSAAFVTPSPYQVVDGLTPVTISGDPDIATINVHGQVVDTSGEGPWTTLVDFSAAQTGQWEYLVAYITDRAGNEFALTEYVGIDHDMPVIALDPRQFPKILHGPLWFTPSVTDSSLVQLTLLVDGKQVAHTDWHSNVLDWPAAAKLTGNHKLTFRGTDEAGHTTEVTRTVTLDNTGPTFRSVAPGDKALRRGTYTATASGVGDPAGISQIDLYANGDYVGSDSHAPYAISVPTHGRSGRVTLLWQMYDTVGNKTSVTRRITVDNKAPTVTITKAPKNKAKVKGTVKVTVSAKDAMGMARVELIVNNKIVATDKTAPYTLSVSTNKQKKTMTVRVRGYDKAGNATTTPPRTWRRR
jgi:subtilisin family serine protease